MVRTSGMKVGSIFGIPIYLHGSWFIMFALITLSLTTHYAYEHPNWTAVQHLLAALLASGLFFGSVLFHELAHSVTAQHYRIPVQSITLFVFGGVARIGKESETWKQEFNIAAAGPASSYLLAAVFWTLARVFPYSELIGALSNWLAQINFFLATFNLIPGFPLDGGRILRSLVWAVTGDYSRSTQFAALGGQAVAYGMIVFGVYGILTNQVVTILGYPFGGRLGGMWLAFIGWFLLTAAQESFAHVAIRNSLQGIRAGDIMTRELPLVPRNTSIEEYVQEVVRTGRRCHLVEADGRVVGLMSVHAVNTVPREEWPLTSVQAVMLPRERIHVTRPEEAVTSILERMQNEDINQMPVVARVDGQERVIGLITRDLILRVLQTRMEIAPLAEQ
jgi:Zn-dependent protease/predicted transcriptional regulator